MGMDRGRNGSNGHSGHYRREYHTNRYSSNEMMREPPEAPEREKYDHNHGKYAEAANGYSRRSPPQTTSSQGAGAGGSAGGRRAYDEPRGYHDESRGYSDANYNDEHPSSLEKGGPQAMIASLEVKIAGAHEAMNQALHEITSKENEKFDLIFSILIELQRRQAGLEDSVRQLKTQLSGGIDQSTTAPQASGQMNTQTNGQMNGQMNAQMGNPSGNQSNGQMNGMSYMQGGQMQMGQQYSNMVAPDGSQAYFTNMPNVVLVASPTNMQQMQPMPMQMQPVQMMSGQPQPVQLQQMQGQPQMQAVPYQSGQNFGWSSSGTQPAVSNDMAGKPATSHQDQAQNVMKDGSEGMDAKCVKAEPRIEEE